MLTTNALLEALPVAVYTTDAEGRITFYNQAAAEMWGHHPPLGSMWCGSWKLYWPDGSPLPHDQCPMAIALKEGRAVRGQEAIAERPDGKRVPFVPYPTPFKDEEGKITGAVNVLVDTSGQKDTDVLAARLAAIVTSSDDAIISKTLDGRITSWNAGARRIFGYEADEMIGEHITKLIPPELHTEEVEIISRLKRGERIDHYETMRVTKDGRRIDISLTVSPLRNQAGMIVGASKVARDITDRKQAEKLKQLLIEELNHRVKNTLATVQAIATQSLARAKTHKEFVTGFGGRMQALAKVHTLLTQTNMQGTDLKDLVMSQVRLGSTDEDRVSVSGPFLFLGSQDAGHLGMVLHELATNARKYGALSVAGGRVTVSWEVRTDPKRCLILLWAESGGPKVRAPETRGFGMTLIEQTVRVHGGEASMHFAEDGLRCRIEWAVMEEQQTDVSPATLRFGESSLLPAPATPSLRGKSVLIVEDEPLVAMDMQSTLRAAGCTVIGPAGTVREARKLIGEHDCDAALVDVNLRGETIDKLLPALRRNDIPYGFVTGYGAKVLSQTFEETVTLTKPFSGEQLLAVVEVLLYLRGAADVVPLKTKRNKTS
jgi:PAS domain S-box-containing protein